MGLSPKSVPEIKPKNKDAHWGSPKPIAVPSSLTRLFSDPSTKPSTSVPTSMEDQLRLSQKFEEAVLGGPLVLPPIPANINPGIPPDLSKLLWVPGGHPTGLPDAASSLLPLEQYFLMARRSSKSRETFFGF